MSTFIKDFIEKEKLSRRNFLLASAYGISGAAAAKMFGPSPVMAATYSDPTIAWSYRNRTNPYWNEIVSGGEAFVESLGKSKDALTHLINEGSSEKSLGDVKSLLAKTNGELALAIDTNDAPNCRPVVEAVAEAGGYVSTIWNKTDDLHPWDFGDNYVSHMTWSDEGPAEQTARILLEAMGGKGGVVHLGGIASNNPAIERLQGLKNALKDYPDIELLAAEPADWDTQKANQVMSAFLTRFGDEITGVHCANDTIAYGVLEALRAEGIDDMPIVSYDGNPQAVGLVAEGKILATVFTNPHWGGGITAALAYHAAIGSFKPSEEPHEHREFYGPTILITPEDAAEFKANYLDSVPTYDWNDFWGPTNGQIQYK
ncbi:sugar ABC transporter substrate-binding protein [Mameliella sediminis]|uniref:sugar ABC transporter substrate-binding protein n=1 Tax=Mameliella sediminis TaxID=2836866 RepID=UPI001C464DA0|nr:sugar ABC transporter substrate-binding protein [Mameliella sediminis]MBY6116937.1 sugar ABC transporter substrate-binding protein [Antarctobacter heliothermus]MBY6146690.1 sugar ABC transporter substrate-binding protein [Mameliella alba]MBV7397186.1 sugar ABC transporter substrate-binding protein [Mameliella sediminis]MBY6163638.1 sugar ABC transporter substrate-binding protein [Mameliella alba]MBY6172031.1 sugar ABC transporter substrate-binding protein [Mameliella alba]